MSTLQFLLTFLVLAVISSGAIVGWFQVTRGEWTITPDGKWKKTGMIFKYWSLFFEQYRKTRPLYYKDQALKDKYDFLRKVHPIIADKIGWQPNRLYINPTCKITSKERKLAEDCLLVNIEEKEVSLGIDWYLWIDDPIYDWPEWIQKPLSSCPPCMSGPYGTAIWLAFLKLQRDAFVWTDFPLLSKICFYIIFLLTLACANSFIAQKLKL